MPALATTTDAFGAIADPHRRALLGELARSERAVGSLVETTGLSQPSVSKHLRVLSKNGLVQVRTDGRRRLYRLQPEALTPVRSWLDEVERLWKQRFDNLEKYLQASAGEDVVDE